MMLVLAVAVQQPQVQAELDRADAEVGQDIVLQVRVQAPGSQSVEVIGQPPLDGLQLRGSNQSSTLQVDGTSGVRTTVWEYTLRAVTPGLATVGPIRVRVGVEELFVDALSIQVHAVDAASRRAVDARIAGIVSRAPAPDGSNEVFVSVIPSPSTIVLGEQVDLVVVAWFPRDIRTRLRARPTLTPPELQGAWSYAQTSVLGVVTTREIRGRLYDLFVHHQVVFPLTAGTLEVGPARVSFNLPVRQSILSREQAREIESQPARVVVAPQPGENRPASFNGIAVSDLRFTVDVDTGGFANGEVATLRATVQGEGNVALWPEPTIEWPVGLRVYPAGTSMHVDADSGLVRGSKTFTYVVAADSIGRFTIPAPRIDYYDPAQKVYREARIAPITLMSRIGRDEQLADAEIMPTMDVLPVRRVDALVMEVPTWGWALLLLFPPTIVLLSRLIPPRARPTVPHKKMLREQSILFEPARDFQQAMAMLVPEGATLNREQLAAALEAAGVEIPLAAHAARVRDRIRQTVYGPPYGIDADELCAEIKEVLRALPGRTARMRGLVALTSLLLLMCAGGTGALAAQAITAEQLYAAGGYRQAADSFLQRAVKQPDQAAHWQNLGLAFRAVGDIPAARAAWLRAARLAPRNVEIRSARQQLAQLDPESQRLAWVSPITVAEAALIGVALWLLGWTVYVLRRRALAVGMLVVSLGVLTYGYYVQRAYAADVALVLRPNTSLRAAPYGPAPSLRLLGEDTMVRILRTDGAWALVERGDSQGWLLTAEVARI